MNYVRLSNACAPNGGSEPGTGWNWVLGIAEQGYEVVALTSPRYREAIESVAMPENLRFIYITPTPAALKVKGQAGVFAQYFSWQQEALKVARTLGPFDLIHHVTWGSLQGGSHLWKLGYPFVFGPVGGGQVMPVALYPVVQGNKRNERLRTLATQLLPFFPPARATLEHANLVIVANNETGELAKKMGAKHIAYMADTSLNPNLLHSPKQCQINKASPFRILWVGLLLSRKAVMLAVETMEWLDDDYELTIIGDGPDGPALAERLQQSIARDRIHWSGQVPWSEVLVAYRNFDAMLFTSARDTLGSQVFEAMANGLPVVTLDHQGVKTHLPDTAGIRVPVGAPAQVARELAKALQQLHEKPQLRDTLAAGAFKEAHTHLQPQRVAKMQEFYKSVIGR